MSLPNRQDGSERPADRIIERVINSGPPGGGLGSVPSSKPLRATLHEARGGRPPRSCWYNPILLPMRPLNGLAARCCAAQALGGDQRASWATGI